MEQRQRQARGWHEHFLGSRLRVNVESVPRLSATSVRWVLDDPRGIPYLFLWWQRGRIGEVVRVGRYVPRRSVIAGHEYVEEVPAGQEWVSITVPDKKDTFVRALRVIRRPLPRHGGRYLLLVCPGFGCGRPRRYLYAWRVFGSSIARQPWECWNCAGLRYGSEGTYIRPRWRCLGGYPRSETWDPYVFASLEEGIEELKRMKQS